MAVSVARFRQDFPEFKETADQLIERKILIATRRVASSVWGTRTTEGVLYLTAHLLSLAPEGEQVRLKMENRGTTYGLEYKQMKREVTLGIGRVA